MAIGVRVNAADDERVLVLHAVHDVLSIRKGGPVGKGGQNSDQALVANGSLSGHAARPDRPIWAINGGWPAADRSPKDTRRVSLCASQTPGQPPGGIFTVCATPTTSCDRLVGRSRDCSFAMAKRASRVPEGGRVLAIASVSLEE